MKNEIDDGVMFPPPGKTPREDTAAVMKFHKLPKRFPPDALAEARKIGGKVSAEGRLDLRRKFIFTCDPVTARDYDDALSLEIDRKGNRVLGVHIADVSHYVRPGSALDREAYRRSTSVYFCDRVVPMLPEELSNGVCSLVPDEDRLAFSVFMTFDKDGEMVRRTFAKSIIRSKARFTYEQVMSVIGRREEGRGKREEGGGNNRIIELANNRIIELANNRMGGNNRIIELANNRMGGNNRIIELTNNRIGERGENNWIAGKRGRVGRREIETIRAINELAQQLRARRFAAGALDLEVPEAEVLLDDDGEMTGIVTRPYDESHQMIEECMVAANEAVAKELWANGVKILARLHEPPDPEKILTLRSELRGLGVRMGNIENPKVFGQFLKSIKKHPLYPTIATMVLRSMKKAVYDSTTIGHFGLAKKHYAHFTSPIRRYPDLTLHRQLAAYLEAKPRAKVDPRLLAKWAAHASEMEEVAAEAERGLVEIKKFRLMEEQINTRQIIDYDAVVAKCTPFGCFVEIPELAVSGLVHVSLLSRRYVKFNESDQSLSAPGGGSWHVGDRIKVHVAKVDFRQRQIDFTPVEQTRGRRRGRRSC